MTPRAVRGAALLGMTLAVLGPSAISAQSQGAPEPAGPLQLAVGLSVWEKQPEVYFPRAFETLERCGVTWVRFDFSWGAIEPQAGDFRWEPYDRITAHAARHRIRILGILAYSTPWTTSDPTGASDKYPPKSLAAWRRFVTATVTRYRQQVPAWEVWNEPDHPGFWRGTPAEYAALLAATHAAVKGADPGATVVLGGLAQGGGSDPRFLERILGDGRHPAGRHFDAMAYHTNFKNLPTVREELAQNRALLQRSGAPAGIWVTESAYTSSRWWQRLSDYKGGPTGQARYVRELVGLAAREGLPFLAWAGILDQASGLALRDEYGQVGLIARDWNAKPAFAELCAVARELGPRPLPGSSP